MQEKALVLAHHLDHPAVLVLPNNYFPASLNAKEYYNFIDFDRIEQVSELTRLENLNYLTLSHLTASYKSISGDVWIPLIQKKIERYFMEKTVWATNLKKVAGILFW